MTSLTVREDPAGTMTPPGRLLLLSTSTSAFTQVIAVGPLPASPTLSVFHNAPNTRSFTGDGGPALTATTDAMSCVCFDPFSRNVYIVASSSVALRAVRPDGIINTVLRGTRATAAVSGDGQLAIASSLNGPRGIVIAPNGDIFFAEASAAKVRVLRSNGQLGTVAGSGTVGFSGDGGPATAAALNFPYGLALFPNGDLVIAQSSSGCLRLVTASTGIISTLYGKCGNLTSAGDGGPASSATFASTHSVVIDAAGGLYICETLARVIRYVSSSTGIINRFAGSGRVFGPPQWTWNPSQEGGPALAVDLLYPLVLAMNPQQTHLYFTDFYLQTVYAVDIASGVLNRVLGLPYDSYNMVPPQVPVSPNPPSASSYFSVRADGVVHNFGFSGPAVNTSLTGYSGNNNKATPTLLGLAFTRSGRLLVSSSYDNFLLSLNLSSGLAEVIAGTGRNFRAGDGGSPLEASLFTPRFLAVDASDNIFFTESGSSTVREISKGSTPNCPEGYMCPCGLRPAPCSSPGSFCPRGSSAALPASPGYQSVALAVPGGDTVFTAQAPCPVGSFCSGGVRVPCLAGSFGTKAAQAAQSSCVQCAAGFYVAVPGAAAPAPAPPPCLPVPPGFTAAPGAAFPVPCPAFSFRSEGRVGCEPCPSGTFAPPGAATCLPFDPATDTASVVGAEFTFQRSFAVDDGSITPAALDRLYVRSAVPIIAAFSIPLLVYLIAPLLPAWAFSSRARAWYDGFLEDSDLYCALAHDVGKKESPINLPTPMGGALSVMFLGVFLAFCVMLVQQFALANTITVLTSLELTAFESSQIFSYPTFLNDDATLDPLFPGGAAAGLTLAVRTAGPRCASVLANGTTAYLAQGVWEPTVSTFNATTGASVHVLRCPQCMVDALSELELLFDATCGSLEVTALTVGGWGTLSMAAFSATNVSSATATLTISAQSVLDFVAGADPESTGYPTGGRSARGLFLSAINVDELRPYNATATAMGHAPPVRLLLRVPAAPLFSRYTMNPNLTVLQLLSNLVGNLGVVGGAAVAFSMWLWLQGVCQKRVERAQKEARERVMGSAGGGDEGSAKVAPYVGEAAPFAEPPQPQPPS